MDSRIGHGTTVTKAFPESEAPLDPVFSRMSTHAPTPWSEGRDGPTILDLLMPEMDGEETLARLREVNSSVPVLISSGYSQDPASIERLLAGGAAGFIPKPCHPEELHDKVVRVLDRFRAPPVKEDSERDTPVRP